MGASEANGAVGTFSARNGRPRHGVTACTRCGESDPALDAEDVHLGRKWVPVKPMVLLGHFQPGTGGPAMGSQLALGAARATPRSTPKTCTSAENGCQ